MQDGKEMLPRMHPESGLNGSYMWLQGWHRFKERSPWPDAAPPVFRFSMCTPSLRQQLFQTTSVTSAWPGKSHVRLPEGCVCALSLCESEPGRQPDYLRNTKWISETLLNGRDVPFLCECIWNDVISSTYLWSSKRNDPLVTNLYNDLE